MAKHEVQITLTGVFYIDDSELYSAYEAKDINEAVRNQLEWIEDSGEIIGFVADTIRDPHLTFKVGDYETSSGL